MKKRLALGAIVVLSSLLLLKGEKAVSVRVSQKMPEKVEISNSKGTYLAKTSEVEVGKNTNLPEGFYEIRNLAKNESDHIQITRDGKNLVDGLELVAEDDIRYADTNRFLIRLKRGDRIKTSARQLLFSRYDKSAAKLSGEVPAGCYEVGKDVMIDDSKTMILNLKNTAHFEGTEDKFWLISGGQKKTYMTKFVNKNTWNEEIHIFDQSGKDLGRYLNLKEGDIVISYTSIRIY